jgi:F-type H+-transporting ATPase subunit delta
MARKLSRRALAQYIADNALDAKKRATVLQQLAGYLVQSRRTKEVDLIVRDVEVALLSRGIVMGTIVSAYDLSVDMKRAIEALVTRQTGAKSVSLDQIIDPSVIGGMKLSLPGQELDQTIRHQLTVLKTRFKKV